MKKKSKIAAILSIVVFTSALFTGVCVKSANAEEVPSSEYYTEYPNKQYANTATLGNWTYSILDINGNEDNSGGLNSQGVAYAPYFEIADSTSGDTGFIPNCSKCLIICGASGNDNGVKIRSNAGSFNLLSFSAEDWFSDSDANGSDINVQFTIYGYKDGSSIVSSDFVLSNGVSTDLTFNSDKKWNNIDEFRIICKDNYQHTPNIAIYLDNLKVSYPVDEAKNSVSLSSLTAKVGDDVTITAAGDRQGETGTTAGDEKYIPASWTLSEGSVAGTFLHNADGTYTSTYIPDKTGNYTITVTYNLQVWDGSVWKDTSPLMTSTATAALTVNPADPVVIQSAPAFNKYEGGLAHSQTKFTMTLKGNTLVSIVKGNDVSDSSKVLTLNKDYTISNNVVTLSEEYLEAQNVGTLTLTFHFSGGSDQSFNINIEDSTPIITVKSDNEQYGTISVTGGTASGTNTYTAAGKSITLTAKPKSGYNFDGWYDGSDNKISNNPDWTFNPIGVPNLVYTAKFVAMPTANVTVNIIGSISGRVSDGRVYLTNGSPQSYTLGKQVDLVASATDGNSSFMYWTDANNHIVSTSSTYSFMPGCETKLNAVFTTSQTGKHLVTFKNANGDIIQQDYVSDGSSATKPTDPTLYGCTFTGWDKSCDSVKSDLVITAQFIRNTATEAYTATVSISDAGTITPTEDTSGNYKYETVTAPAVEGKKFSHWEDGSGNILCYDSTYKFYLVSNVTVTPVYVNSTDTVEQQANIVLAAYSDASAISFVAQRIVPSGCTVISHGIILTSNAATGDSNASFIIGGTGVLKGTAKTSGLVGTYILNKLNPGSTKWYGRGYVIYKDSNGNVVTVYSAIVSK